MATVPPPPSKRQKTEAAERSRLQQEINEIPTNLGSVRIQFFDASTGTAAGALILVPVADATVKNLELLVNSLQGHVCMIRVHDQKKTDRGRLHLSEFPTALPCGEKRAPMRRVGRQISPPACTSQS